ncbi:MAG: hypothetical protein ACLRPW_04615 [Intestinibacter sp.]
MFHSALLIIFPLYVVLASLSFILSISGFCNGPCESFSVLTSPSETVFVMNDHADLFIFPSSDNFTVPTSNSSVGFR